MNRRDALKTISLVLGSSIVAACVSPTDINTPLTSVVANASGSGSVPGNPDPIMSTVNPTWATIKRRESRDIIISVRDASGTPIPGAYVQVTKTGVQGTLSPVSGWTNGNGTFISTFTAGNRKGLAEISALVSTSMTVYIQQKAQIQVI